MTKYFCLASCAILGTSLAFGGETPMVKEAPVQTDSTEVFFGGTAREYAWYTYLGSNVSFGGDINSSGLFLHLVAGYGEYDYTIFPSGQNVQGAMEDYTLGIGYKWAFETGAISVIAAADYEDHQLNQLAPLNTVQGDELGLEGKVSAWFGNAGFIYGFDGSYSSNFDGYFARGVVAKDLGSFFVGPEVVILGNQEFEESRLGLTVGGLSVGPADLGLSLGYQWNEGDAGSRDEESFYGGFHASFKF